MKGLTARIDINCYGYWP